MSYVLQDNRSGLGRMSGAAYFVALLLVLTPAFDFVGNVLPLHPSQLDWRYGVSGLLSGFLLTPLLGMVLASAVALAGNQRGARVVVGSLNLACALALGLLVPLFVLDFFQLRASVPAGELPLFQVAGMRAIAKHVTAAFAFLWLGTACLRALPRRSAGVAPGVITAPERATKVAATRS